MKTMSLVKSLVGAAALMVLAACGQVGTPAPEPSATTENEMCSADVDCIYYTDATYTVECGEREVCISCTAQTYSYGCRTSYSRCYNYGSC